LGSTSQLPFSIPPGHNLGVGSFASSWDNKNGNIELTITSGDSHRKVKSLPCPSILKMDIEGYEKPALSGLKNTLAECRPVIFLEVTMDSGSSFKDLMDLKSTIPREYKIYSVIEKSPRTTNIISYEMKELTGKVNLLMVPTNQSSRIQRILAEL